jgi:glucose/arabinose dehydrogenase
VKRRLTGGFLGVCVSLAGCSSGSVAESPRDGGASDSTTDSSHDGGSYFDHVLPPDIDAMPPPGSFCALPGSVVFTPQGPEIVPGSDASTPSLDWLSLPVGFCAHFFATVPNARQIRMAPDGHLFVASPTTGTTGGGPGGLASIVVLPDNDADGVADQVIEFLAQLPSTQGLLFNGGYLYFQDNTTIRRVPFKNGDLQPSGAVQPVTTITTTQSSIHWPKMLDVAQDGTLYVTNGGDQSDRCLSTHPLLGSIFSIGAGGTTTLVSRGFRNPIAMRCETDHNVCLAVELVLDYSSQAGGREKLLPVRAGDDWGYPCCATQGVPYSNVTYGDTGKTPNCNGVVPEPVSFFVGHTPFGLAFETGRWPAPWTGRVFVTLHGEYVSWEGARVVGIPLDGNGLPMQGSDMDGGDTGSMVDFATGWDDGHNDHGRPAPIEFAPDGRMFLGDDNKGLIMWIAPINLKP